MAPAVLCGAGQETQANGSCGPCAAGTYKTAPGRDSCRPCPAQSTSVTGALSRSQCYCRPGFYPEKRFTSEPVCSVCPFGASCPGGARASSVPVAAAGFYQASIGNFRPCPYGPACLGDNQCAENHIGADCSACTEGFGIVSDGASQRCGTCEEAGTCATDLGPLLLIAGIILSSLSAITVYCWAWRRRRLCFRRQRLLNGKSPAADQPPPPRALIAPAPLPPASYSDAQPGPPLSAPTVPAAGRQQSLSFSSAMPPPPVPPAGRAPTNEASVLEAIVAQAAREAAAQQAPQASTAAMSSSALVAPSAGSIVTAPPPPHPPSAAALAAARTPPLPRPAPVAKAAASVPPGLFAAAVASQQAKRAAAPPARSAAGMGGGSHPPSVASDRSEPKPQQVPPPQPPPSADVRAAAGLGTASAQSAAGRPAWQTFGEIDESAARRGLGMA